MPTPKQVKYHYKRLLSLRSKLSETITDAKTANVIVYANWEESPYQALEKVREALLKTTEKARAQAIHDECLEEL